MFQENVNEAPASVNFCAKTAKTPGMTLLFLKLSCCWFLLNSLKY